MKTWSKFPIILGIMSWVLANAWAGPAPTPEAAIQAIQQAPDPSAVVAAYANGVAIDRNNPQLNAAYVARMVDLGLPEMAYHQAELVTTLQSNDGLAWGVIAYVHARRGEMDEAIPAINLAGQFAPENTFVQRTAGEIVAWYDTKADPATLPDNAKAGLAQLRSGLGRQTAFISAYSTARSAYQTQSNAAAPEPAQGAPSPYAPGPQTESQADQVAPLGYATPAPPPAVYYPEYYYDWGPTWVEPAPWWWWRPVGFFGGFSFIPFSTVIVFDHHDFFHHPHSFAHNRFAHDRDFFRNRSFHHDGLNVAFRDSNRAFFHRDGKTSFFSTAARANTSMAQFHTVPNLANRNSVHGARNNISVQGTRSSTGFAGTTTSTGVRSPTKSGFVVDPPRLTPTLPSTGTPARSSPFAPSVTPRSRLTPTGRFAGEIPRQNFRVPTVPTVPNVPAVPNVPTVRTVPTTPRVGRVPAVPTMPTVPTVRTMPTVPTFVPPAPRMAPQQAPMPAPNRGGGGIPRRR